VRILVHPNIGEFGYRGDGKRSFRRREQQDNMSQANRRTDGRRPDELRSNEACMIKLGFYGAAGEVTGSC
jgi:hypothetical protein